MLFTFLTIIVCLLAFIVASYACWSRYVQRDQQPGRHRTPSPKTTPTAA